MVSTTSIECSAKTRSGVNELSTAAAAMAIDLEAGEKVEAQAVMETSAEGVLEPKCC
jgi:hypothetical protein